MTGFRITKYDPSFRTAENKYTRNEWQSVYDIGKEFYDGILTLEKYLQVEDSYVESIKYFMRACDISSMKIAYIEKDDISDDDFPLVKQCQPWLEEVAEGTELSGELLDNVIRMNLRKACFTKLVGAKNSYIHIGGDYYMFAGADVEDSVINKKNFPTLIFVEDGDSPYLYDEDDDE